jgi:hypothetical protein
MIFRIKYLLCFAFMLPNILFCQRIGFKIEKLTVERIITQPYISIDSNGTISVVLGEDYTIGPQIFVECVIKNLSADTIWHTFTNFKLTLHYKYNGKMYEWQPIAYNFYEDTCIFPSQEFRFSFEHGFGWTDFYRNKRYKAGDIINCAREMLEILPTIRVQYENADINIYTDEIVDVIIGDFPYVYDNRDNK